jgi:PAS domain-containing protein
LLFFLCGVIITLLLYNGVVSNERRRIRMETTVTAEQVRLRIEAWIDSRTALVEHLGNEQFDNATDVAVHFDHQAQTFVDLYPGIQALNFIDRQWIIRRVVPAEPNAAALGKDLHFHPNPGVPEALGRSEKMWRLTSTPVIDLLQIGKGFAVYRPLRDWRGNWLGFVNGVFRIVPLVETCLYEDELRERFSLYLADDDGTIAFRQEATEAPPYQEWGTQVPVRVVDRDWTLHLVPNPTHLAEARTTADEGMTVVGLLTLAGLAFILRLLLVRQEALRQSQEKYRLLVENQSDLVVKLDPHGNFLYVSPSFCAAFDCSEGDILGTGFLPLVHPDDRENTQASLDSVQDPRWDRLARLDQLGGSLTRRSSGGHYGVRP